MSQAGPWGSTTAIGKALVMGAQHHQEGQWWLPLLPRVDDERTVTELGH